MSAFRRTVAWLSLFQLLLVTTLASAAEYYVSPAGDDEGTGTSLAEPWGSIAKANAAVQPGDVVYLRGGKYLDDPIRPARSGTSSARIHYKAYQGEEPVLTSDRVSGLGSAIELSDRSYITVEGVHVDGVKPNPNATVDHFVSMYSGSYNTIVGCTFRYATGWHGIRLRDGSNYNKIVNNVMDVVGTWDDGSGEDMGDMLQINGSHHNLVEGNKFSRAAHNLLQLTGEYNVVRNNEFSNDWSEIAGAGKGARNLSVIGRYNVFEGNVVRDSGPSIDNDYNVGMKIEGRHNIIRRNLLIDNLNAGASTQTRSGQKWAQHNRIVHNTFYGNGGPAWLIRYHDGGNAVIDNVFKNNIVFRNGHHSVVGGADLIFNLRNNPSGPLAESVIENNLIAARAAGDASIEVRGTAGELSLSRAESEFPDVFRGNIQEVPTFVASEPVGRDDFELAPGSRGIDEGAPLTRTRSAGSGREVELQDAGYFFDGFSIVPGDRVQIGDSAPVSIVGVDYASHLITVSDAIEWGDGAPVSLEHGGSAPDIGAFELGLNEPAPAPGKPMPPASFNGTIR